jgi:hypothetical protein
VARLEQGIEELAAKFVCVRAVQMRGLDTAQYQFDWDLTWAALLMHPDGTIYGRYGSRIGIKEQSEKLYSAEALKNAMRRALDLHAKHAQVKDSLKPKLGKSFGWKTPETAPSLADRFAKNDTLPKDCIHCHHVWKGVRRSMLMAKKPLPDNLVYLYPMPDTWGMQIDASHGTRVRQVVKDSLADKAGIREGDVVEAIDGAPMLSLADIQFVLQNCADNANLKVEVSRGGGRVACTVNLCGDWRKATDFTWRESTWEIRPGMKLEPLSADERAKAGLKDGGLKIGFMGPQSPSRKAGFRDGDILMSVGGQPVPATEKEYLALLRQKFLVGQKLKWLIFRDGKKTDVSMELP